MPALRRSRPRPTRQRRGDGERPQRRAGEVHERLQRRPRVRHPDEHHPPGLRRPRPPEPVEAAGGPGLRGVVAGGPDHQATHAVAHERQLADPHRPGGDEPVQQAGELATVGGDVAAGVVAHRERGDAVVARQQGSVGLVGCPAEAPHRLGRHEAVDEHDEASGRLRDRPGKPLTVEGERLAAGADRHGHGEGGARIGEEVTEQAVDHRERLVAVTGDRGQQAEQPRRAGEEPSPVLGALDRRGQLGGHQSSLRADRGPRTCPAVHAGPYADGPPPDGKRERR